jgi:hypothetical protein
MQPDGRLPGSARMDPALSSALYVAPTAWAFGAWSGHSDLNRGPAVYDVDRPKRRGQAWNCERTALSEQVFVSLPLWLLLNQSPR